ncbi:dUTP diphosphatase [Periweissella fabaria]|uniref:dUTP diphosphatase n=1 Tax=Periweissella fabaria TaxID=546157 RepID=A0ABM8Z7V1_9LACO|nr:dUTP diphosphatase [Periweissella fabaria]MCM0597997.1 dUTP diphosphatase [Periweissella fabaria]CAH0417402.1 Deoxyuridine 5'-triphosphate nucleotidohydrolase [Periweissella fabaria]
MKRGFEIITKYADANLELPQRATTQAAGYDFQAAEDITIPSIWKWSFLKALWQIKHQETVSENDLTAAQATLKPFLIPTGVKAFMQPEEFLMIANRSSNPLKRSLVVPNGVGIIDADYYNNAKNEGAIFVQILNFGLFDCHIKKGERIAQGIFIPFLLADHDASTIKATRNGGFGSSGIK